MEYHTNKKIIEFLCLELEKTISIINITNEQKENSLLFLKVSTIKELIILLDK